MRARLCVSQVPKAHFQVHNRSQQSVNGDKKLLFWLCF